jgi:hypothetical protein
MKRVFMSVLACALISVSAQQPAVLTKAYDVARTSANTQETTLTPAAVRTHGMLQQPNIPVIGDARGMEAQPLILPGITINNATHAVMVLPSMANVIRGVEATNGTGLWQTLPLCVPVNSTNINDMWGINDHFGALSTGVIDPDTAKLYQVLTCSSDNSGSQTSMQQYMYVVDVRTGNVLTRALVQGVSNGLNYATSPRKQRAALLLWNHGGVKTVILMAGSFTEAGPDATGWIMAFDTFDNQFKAALATRAGGWMSGLGPAMEQSTGYIYLGLGNGTFNGVNAFGESVLQLQYTPPTATSAAAFTVLNAWAPFSDAARTCANPQLTQPTKPLPSSTVTGTSAPSTTRMPLVNVPGAAMPMNTDCSLQWGDQDAHLTGTLIERYHLYMTAGKDGVGYVLNTAAFPHTQPADFANPKANCAKAMLYQLGWNLGVDSCPTTAPTLNVFPGNLTRHQHAPMPQYAAPDGSLYIFAFAENSPLQAWQVSPDGTMTYVARGQAIASPQALNDAMHHGGMPGGFCTLSSNAGANAILWCSIPDGDANRSVTTGHMVAYDLTNLAALKGSNNPIPVLWQSGTYRYNKFMAPTVWNGQVYLPDYAGSVQYFALNGTN